MGFRNNAYASIWDVRPVTGKTTSVRLSTSRKNKQTGNYEQDFSGYVMIVGQDMATKAAQLTRGDRIKIGNCEVTTKYDPAKKIQYTNYTIFDFEKMERRDYGHAQSAQSADPTPAAVYEGETSEAELPF